MKVRLIALALALAAMALVVTGAVSAGGARKAAPARAHASKLIALISDIGHFDDRSFNQSQLEGLKRAKRVLKVRTLPLQSNSTSDYKPNLNTAVQQNANLIIAAGFLLAGDLNTVAQKYPKTHFAITDYDVTGSPFNGRKNVEGLTYAANESGCLVGILAAKVAKKMTKHGKVVIGAVGGYKIPPVDIWIAGYRFCAKRVVPGIQVQIQYSGDFVKADLCKNVAETEIANGAKVLFQVAGGCGLGTLKAAAAHKIWGIGVDKDQYRDAKRVLTSGVKRVDNGVFAASAQEKAGHFKGGSNLLFNLKNHGMSVGKTNPIARPYLPLMNKYKRQIIAKKLHVPTKL
jgi:basic membrane protein A